MICQNCGCVIKREKSFVGTEKEIKGMFFCSMSCLDAKINFEQRMKQGALEELWLIGKELTSFIGGDKSTNIERNRINNYIQKRIKELEGVEKEWV